MDALVSANSLAAEAMKMADEIGTLAPGLEADIIAIDGDGLKDITAVSRVIFVSKGGVVYRNEIRRCRPQYAVQSCQMSLPRCIYSDRETTYHRRTQPPFGYRTFLRIRHTIRPQNVLFAFRFQN